MVNDEWQIVDPGDVRVLVAGVRVPQDSVKVLLPQEHASQKDDLLAFLRLVVAVIVIIIQLLFNVQPQASAPPTKDQLQLVEKVTSKLRSKLNDVPEERLEGLRSAVAAAMARWAFAHAKPQDLRVIVGPQHQLAVEAC